MSLAAPIVPGRDLLDVIEGRPVLDSDVPYVGMFTNVRVDQVDLGAGGVVRREYVEHPGAVHVVALRDVDGIDHVCMIRQYRHPVQSYLWELPAGLLDIPGEPPVHAAQRELAEEVGLGAARWDVLLDFYASPGGFGERYRFFLARDLRDVDLPDGFVREAEEVDLRTVWVPLEQAYEAVLANRLHNPGAVAGLMAAHGSRALGWSTLRPADAPWPEHPAYRENCEEPARPRG